MKLETRLVTVFVVRLVFVAFAVYFALVGAALPGAHWLSRVALAALFLVFSVLVGEVARLSTQFEIFLRSLRAAGVKVDQQAAEEGDKHAIGILIRALGSREASTREKAYSNLVRITGQDLAPDKAAWEAWWKEEQKRD